MLLWLLACPKSPEIAAQGERPRIPAPLAPIYAHVESRPLDPMVAAAWPRTVDEALAGAGGALALRIADGFPIAAGELRWRAVLAGYPWPVVSGSSVEVKTDEVPDDLIALATRHAEKHDVGLVRARGAGTADVWVLMLGQRRGSLGGVPREPELGRELAFPGYGVSAVTPNGDRVQSAGGLRVDVAGEWLVALSDAQGETARFPLYVGVATPSTPPFAASMPTSMAGAPERQVEFLLERLAEWYGRDAAVRDPMLDAMARARLRTYAAGGAPPDAATQLGAAGFLDATAAECAGESVAVCLDNLWWTDAGHVALAGPWAIVGYAAMPTEGGVLLSVTVADRSADRAALPLR